MTRAIWVAELVISDRVAEKVGRKHGISVQEVRDAVVCVAGLRAHSDQHKERGLRYMVEVDIGGKPVVIVLYPAAKRMDSYALGSAYRV